MKVMFWNQIKKAVMLATGMAFVNMAMAGGQMSEITRNVEAANDGPILNEKGLKPYEVHEWGVFSVYPSVRYANVDMAAEWSTLPKEMYRAFPSNQVHLPYFGPVLKPIVYFHWNSDDTIPATPFSMRVMFPEGRPMVWYPATESPIWTGEKEQKDEALTNSLAWQLYLRNTPKSKAEGGHGKWENPPNPAADHWYTRARQPKAERVFAYGSHGNRGQETTAEQFVYYDGVMAPLDYIRAKRDDQKKIALVNTAPFAIFDLYAVERTGGELRLATVSVIPSGTKDVQLDWKTISRDDWQKSTSQALAKDLARTGLQQDESDALVDIWRPGFFEQDGLTILYRLPQKEYSRVTALTLDPAPAKLVRVGLVLHPHAEPELADRVNNLIIQLTSSEKDAAAEQLIKLGGAALDGLYKAQKKNPAPAIQKLIQQIDVTSTPRQDVPNNKQQRL